MIDHAHKIIFIHIPKNAGTSIEREAFKNFGFTEKHSRAYLYGYDRDLHINLQHATVNQLLENELLTSAILEEYVSFCVVRNPFTRAVSGYNWLKRDLKIYDTFENFLLEKGAFSPRELLNKATLVEDHFYTQSQFITSNKTAISPEILKFENVTKDFNALCKRHQLPFQLNSYFKKSKSNKLAITKLLTTANCATILEKYKDDFDNYDYSKSFSKVKFLLGYE